MAAKRSGDFMYGPSANPKKSVVSINLMDLNVKHKRKEPPPPPANKIQQQAKSDVNVSELLGNDTSYQTELLKLLAKAKGTPYEASVRRFIDSKLGSHALAPLLNDPSEAVSVTTEEEEQMARQSAYLRQKEKAEILATPVNRPEPVDTPRRFNYVSTNTLGRQRPHPSTVDHRRPIGAGPISVREFNTWLRRTSRWKQTVDDSISSIRIENARGLQDDFHPQLDKRSIALARRVHERGYAQAQQASCNARMPSEGGAAETSDTAKGDSKPIGTGSPDGQAAFCSVDEEDAISDIADERIEKHVLVYNAQEIRENTKHNAGEMHSSVEIPAGSYTFQISRAKETRGRSRSPGNVYDRLSARGKQYAEQRLNWAPPELPYTFTPEITSRSRKIANRMRSRSRSADRLLSRADNEQQQSMTTSMQENSSTLINNIACEPDATPMMAGKPSMRAYSPRASPRAAPRSASAPRGRSAAVDTRSSSAQRERSRSRSYYEDELTFKPKLTAETKRLVARKNETFEDRLNKSVENYHVLNLVSKRSGSPGPGYYTNVSVPAWASKSSRVSSPGKGGYSFGKFSKDFDISIRY